MRKKKGERWALLLWEGAEFVDLVVRHTRCTSFATACDSKHYECANTQAHTHTDLLMTMQSTTHFSIYRNNSAASKAALECSKKKAYQTGSPAETWQTEREKILREFWHYPLTPKLDIEACFAVKGAGSLEMLGINGPQWVNRSIILFIKPMPWDLDLGNVQNLLNSFLGTALYWSKIDTSLVFMFNKIVFLKTIATKK